MRNDKDTWPRAGLRRLTSGVLIGTLLLFLAPVGLTGCHTAEGAGRDIEETGEVMEDTFTD